MPAPANPTAAGVPVHCGHSKIVPIGELRPNPVNPWKHPARQIEAYASVLRSNGWRRPITISARSGFIVRGHGARLAALNIGATEVPIEIQSYASEAEEHADMLADNRLPELATVDSDKLRDLLGPLAAVPFATGYSADDVAKVIGSLTPAAQYPIGARLNERHDYVVIVCDSETDFLFLKNLAGVQVEQSYKNSHVGEGRVVPFARFLSSLRENLNSIAQARGANDDAPAVPAR